MKSIYLILVCLIGSTVFALDVWDVATDFSATTNPNGPWMYGQRADKWTAWSPTNPLVVAPYPRHILYGYNDVWIGNQGNVPQVGKWFKQSGTLDLWEGDMGGHGPYGVQWTAPYTGTFRIEGMLWDAYTIGGHDDRDAIWTLGKGTYNDGYDTSYFVDSALNHKDNPIAYSRILTLNMGEVVELKNSAIPAYNGDFSGFTMTITQLGVPAVPEPADGSTICEISNVVLSWEEGPETPISYDVEIFSDDPNILTVYLSNITPVSPRTSVNAPSPLIAGKTYYWRVDTHIENPDPEVVTGAEWRFTTPSTVPGVPSAPDPADNTVGVFIDASLSWAAVEGVCKYDVYLGKVSGNLTKVGADVADTTYQPSSALDSNTEYFWQVAAKNYLGVSTLGPEWSFTTATPFCGQTGQVYDPMDFDKNCYVDLSDFEAFAREWLNCTDPADQVNCDSWNGQ